jgi:hypothetical protein
MNRQLAWLGLSLALIALAPDRNGDANRGQEQGRKQTSDSDVGKSYQVPYRVTQTNHFLVRVRINGKGPFHFLVDTGAPALYIATETARKIGLEPVRNEYWTAVGRLDFEGGARLTDIPARVEDSFQLVGMNALGLPGTSIDGLLGLPVLARFRIELDPTRDRMTWTRLDYEPSPTPGPRRVASPREGPPGIDPLAGIPGLTPDGKLPEDQLHLRGFLGIELAEAAGEVRAARVLAGSPAALAGVRAGDLLVRLRDRDVTSIKAAREAVAAVRPDDRVTLVVRRGVGTGTDDLTLTAGEGL